MGSGVARMKQLMTDAGLPLPVFKTSGIFTVIFQRPEKSSVKSSVKILNIINENPNITIPEMADKLQLSTRAVEKQLARLKSKGAVNRVGSDKEGYWKIRNDESK